MRMRRSLKQASGESLKEFKADREVKKEPAEEEEVFVCYQARILKSV